MMDDKFTPGPWEIGSANFQDHKQSHIGVRSNDWVVAEVQTDVEDLPGLANARLIAAAPDLLEALRKALNAVKESTEYRQGNPAFEQAVASAHDAIIKAGAKP